MMRGTEWLQVGGVIGLSALLCLIAVWAGTSPTA